MTCSAIRVSFVLICPLPAGRDEGRGGEDLARNGAAVWETPGAALGRITKLDNPIRNGKHFCPNLPEVMKIVFHNGHENKLGRETGES